MTTITIVYTGDKGPKNVVSAVCTNNTILTGTMFIVINVL